MQPISPIAQAMSEFIHSASEGLVEYFHLVVEEMMNAYHVSRAEAVARINWHCRDRIFQQEDDLVLHGMPDYWAARIYFEDYMDHGQLKRRVKEPPPRNTESGPSIDPSALVGCQPAVYS